MDFQSERHEPFEGASSRQANAVTLQPNSNGYVAVETESGSLSCVVQRDWIACETPLTYWPLHEDGTPYHGVIGYADGSVKWADGQMGNVERVRVDNREFHALGWTIVAIDDGLQFANDRTGHSVCVTTRNVRGF